MARVCTNEVDGAVCGGSVRLYIDVEMDDDSFCCATDFSVTHIIRAKCSKCRAPKFEGSQELLIGDARDYINDLLNNN